MSESKECGFALTGVRRGGIALAAVIVAIAVFGVPEALAVDLEKAYVERVGGIAPELRGDSGRVHVRITVQRRPLLRDALAGAAARLLRPSPSRPSVALGIADLEKRAARGAERSYETGLAHLSDASIAELRQLRQVSRLVRGRGGEVDDLHLALGSLTASVKASQLEVLGGSGRVAAIDPAPEGERLSGVGTAAVGAPSWWAAGFTGGNGAADTVAADAAVVSEAPDPDHPAFATTVVDNDPAQAVSDHGTHTGGIVASGDATYPGVAPGVDRLIGSSNETYAIGFPGGSGAADPAETLNISFGSPATDDHADDSIDILTAVFGVGQAFGAGNDNVNGTPTVGNIGRNVLTVGGFNDVGTVTSTDDVVLGISSRGPTPGGRKKPDLTAPAGAVVAPSAAWNSPPSNPDFTAMTGTSFAAPHVAGAMTLLEGAGVADAKAQRAILINSARDWNGAATGLAGWVPPQATWQPEVGWGELDLTAALAQRSNYSLGSVAEGEAAYYLATVPGGGKGTLAYELRGFFVGFPNPGTQTFAYTQSNLDLHQYLANGQEVLPPAAPPHGGGPDAIDPNDTVEQVRAPLGPSQEVIYKVEAASTVEGASAEPFAVAASGSLDQLEPAVVKPVSLAAVPSGPVACGSDVTITATFENESADLAAEDARAAIDLPPGLTLVGGDVEQEVSGGDLEPNQSSEQHSWTVEVDADGGKQVTVSGIGGALGTDFERSAQLAVAADCVPPGTTIESGPSGATNSAAPAFGFSATDGPATFECSLDGAGYGPCESPADYPGLPEGEHSFAVRAVDSAGNADPSPAERSFAVDRSVSGGSIRVGSAKIAKSGRRVGSLRVALAEPGVVVVVPKGFVRGRAIDLATRKVSFGHPGAAKVSLRVGRIDRKRVRRTERRGGKVVIRVRSTFEDEIGNEERGDPLRFAAR